MITPKHRFFTASRVACILFASILPSQSCAQDAATPWVSAAEYPLYFAVLVEDVDASLDWYSDVFGLEKIGGSTAEDGSWRIENLKSDLLFVELIRDDRAEAVDRARGLFKVGFQVPDVEDVADRVEEAGEDRPRILDFGEYGIRILQIEDPDGNKIQLSSPLRD